MSKCPTCGQRRGMFSPPEPIGSPGARIFEKMVDAKLRGEDQSAEIGRLKARIHALEEALRAVLDQCYSDKFDVVIKAGLMPYTMKDARALLHDSQDSSTREKGGGE